MRFLKSLNGLLQRTTILTISCLILEWTPRLVHLSRTWQQLRRHTGINWRLLLSPRRILGRSMMSLILGRMMILNQLKLILRLLSRPMVMSSRHPLKMNHIQRETISYLTSEKTLILLIPKIILLRLRKSSIQHLRLRMKKRSSETTLCHILARIKI